MVPSKYIKNIIYLEKQSSIIDTKILELDLSIKF